MCLELASGGYNSLDHSESHKTNGVRTLRHYNLVPKCPGAEVSREQTNINANCYCRALGQQCHETSYLQLTTLHAYFIYYYAEAAVVSYSRELCELNPLQRVL